MFTGDAVLREIDDEALKIREKDRQEARRRFFWTPIRSSP